MFNLKANAELENLDTVPAELHSAYKAVETPSETEGEDATVSYVLDTDNPLVEVLSGSSEALRKARDEAKRNKHPKVDLSPLKEYGETPEDILKNFTTKLEETLSSGDKKIKEKIDALRESMSTQYTSKIGELEKQLNDTRGQYIKSRVDGQIKSALADAQDLVNPSMLETLIKNEVGHSVGDDGAVSVFIKDNDGSVRLNPSDGREMTIADRIKQMRSDKDYAGFFKASDRSGTNTNSRQDVSTKPVKTEEMNSRQKIMAGLASRQK